MKLSSALLFTFRLLVLTTALSAVSCAGFHTMPVANAEDRNGVDDDKANGIRYYEPALFILVYSDAAESVKTEVLTLPDTTRKMVITPRNILSKSKLSLKFDHGMLAEGSDDDPTMSGTFDSTEVPKAVIDLAQKAASAYFGNVPGIFANGKGGAEGPKVVRHNLEAPRLYKVLLHGTGVTLQGAHPSDNIELLATIEP